MRHVTELEEIQDLALSILIKVDRFCAEQNIEYFLAYGTLLGAVRHKGFIPWDDDIDLWMKRKDYERFLSEFPAWGEKEGLFINSARNVRKNYNRVYSQVCLENTKLIANDRNTDFREGFFLDVFPIDGTPDDPVRRWFRLTRLQLIKNIGSAAGFRNRGVKGWKQLILLAGSMVFRPFNTSKIMERYDHIAAKSDFDDSMYIQIPYALAHGRNKLMPRQLFDQSQKTRFGVSEYSIPAAYDEILTRIYGNYMELPPEEKRKPHHDFELYVEDSFDNKV